MVQRAAWEARNPAAVLAKDVAGQSIASHSRHAFGSRAAPRRARPVPRRPRRTPTPPTTLLMAPAGRLVRRRGRGGRRRRLGRRGRAARPAHGRGARGRAVGAVAPPVVAGPRRARLRRAAARGRRGVLRPAAHAPRGVAHVLGWLPGRWARGQQAARRGRGWPPADPFRCAPTGRRLASATRAPAARRRCPRRRRLCRVVLARSPRSRPRRATFCAQRSGGPRRPVLLVDVVLRDVSIYVRKRRMSLRSPSAAVVA